MFVRLRIMAHNALKDYMHSDHAPLYDDTTRLIYDIIKTAETNEAFANELDFECANAFNNRMADDYDDLINLFDCLDDAPEGLQHCLRQYNIIKED